MSTKVQILTQFAQMLKVMSRDGLHSLDRRKLNMGICGSKPQVLVDGRCALLTKQKKPTALKEP
jgi:hypothetical protein